MEIPLVNGGVALIDDEDYAIIKDHDWRCKPHGHTKYAYATRKRYSGLAMHRLILGLTDSKMYTDHRNHNGLDNRRSNLRIATLSQNHHNILFNKSNTSGYKGVCWDKTRNLWRAYIGFNGNKGITIGRFGSAIEAAKAYDAKAIELYGEFACPNFPIVTPQTRVR